MPQGQPMATFFGELQQDLWNPVDKVDAVVRGYADAVGIFEDALSPRIEELAALVEDHVRMVRPRKDVDVVL